MNLKKAIIEVLKSGFIPVVGGAFILFTAPDYFSGSTAVFWGTIGLGFIIIGIFVSNEYIEKSSLNNQEKRS